jgi:diphthamide synthase subunit DPH2
MSNSNLPQKRSSTSRSASAAKKVHRCKCVEICNAKTLPGEENKITAMNDAQFQRHTKLIKTIRKLKEEAAIRSQTDVTMTSAIEANGSNGEFYHINSFSEVTIIII